MIGGHNCYFDTGVVPSGDLNITGLFLGGIPSGSYNAYYFGARNTSSTSSNGQLNFLTGGQGQTAYLGYGSARKSVSDFNGGYLYVKNTGNAFDVVDNLTVNEISAGTFSVAGTKSMYLLALNNAGSVSYGGGASDCEICLCEFSIFENGTETHHYIPCFDTTDNVFGLYDLVPETFLNKQGTGSFYTSYLLEAHESAGGEAYIMNDTIGYSKKKYIAKTSTDQYPERLVAIPKEGYEFLNWTDSNGNVLSDEEYFEYTETGVYSITADTVITANFVKKTEMEMGCNCQLLGLQYGVGKYSFNSPAGSQSDLYAEVLSYKIVKDSLSSVTSVIEVKEVPDLYQADMPVFLFSQKGKMLWCGVISIIDGTTLTCREAEYMYSVDMVMLPLSSKESVSCGIYGYVGTSVLYGHGSTDSLLNPNPALKRRAAVLMDNFVPNQQIYEDRIVFGETVDAMPKIADTSITNAEDFLYQLSGQYNVIYESSLYNYTDSNYPDKGVKHLLLIRYINPAKYGSMSIGTNMEAISNVQIMEENRNANSLIIFNSAGTSIRGIYGTEIDGTISDMSTLTSSFLAYTDCVNKVVMSDESIKSLVRENLGNAMLNHKITFDVDLTCEMFRFSDFKIGKRVNFYDGNRIYNSVITGMEFSGLGYEDIRSLRITLGRVRTKLTSKLNLGKIKK